MEAEEMDGIGLSEGPHLHRIVSSAEVRRGDSEPDELP
jgi:hypothetical protein